MAGTFLSASSHYDIPHFIKHIEANNTERGLVNRFDHSGFFQEKKGIQSSHMLPLFWGEIIVLFILFIGYKTFESYIKIHNLQKYLVFMQEKYRRNAFSCQVKEKVEDFSTADTVSLSTMDETSVKSGSIDNSTPGKACVGCGTNKNRRNARSLKRGEKSEDIGTANTVGLSAPDESSIKCESIGNSTPGKTHVKCVTNSNSTPGEDSVKGGSLGKPVPSTLSTILNNNGNLFPGESLPTPPGVHFTIRPTGQGMNQGLHYFERAVEDLDLQSLVPIDSTGGKYHAVVTKFPPSSILNNSTCETEQVKSETVSGLITNETVSELVSKSDPTYESLKYKNCVSVIFVVKEEE